MGLEPVDPDLLRAALLLPPDYIDRFGSLVAGEEPLSRWNMWWTAHAADLEQTVGIPLFKQIKRNPLRAMRLILAALGLVHPPSPDMGRLTPEEYAVNSALIQHAMRHEAPQDAVLAIHARTRGLPMGRYTIERLGTADELLAVGSEVVDDLYRRNLRVYDLEPVLSLGCQYRLLPTADLPIRPGGGVVWEVARVAFDAGGRVAMACWHRNHSHGFRTYAAVVRATGTAPTVGPDVEVANLSLTEIIQRR